MSYLEDQLYTHTGHRLLLIGNNEDFFDMAKANRGMSRGVKSPMDRKLLFSKKKQ